MWVKHQGQGFAVAEVNSVPQRDALINALEDKCKADDIRIYHIKFTPGDISFSGQLRFGIEAADRGNYQAIFLYNFEFMLDRDEEKQKNYLRSINFAREILTLTDLPIVFWMPEFAARLFNRYAPDFWDWRGVVIEFKTVYEETLTSVIKATVSVEDDIIAHDPVSRDNLIKLLERQYNELSPKDKQKPNTVENIIAPLAGLYREKGLYQQALHYMAQALQTDKKYYGDNHQNVARDLNNLGGAYDSLGQYEKAREYIQIAYDILQEFLPPDHPDVIRIKNNLDSIQG